jgi:hypothetical protein
MKVSVEDYPLVAFGDFPRTNSYTSKLNGYGVLWIWFALGNISHSFNVIYVAFTGLINNPGESL